MPRYRGVIVLGMKELDRALKELGARGSRRIVVSGMRAGLTVIARAVRKEITATRTGTEHEASLRAGMRKAVKSRFAKRKRGGDYEAKVGFGVGMKGSKRAERLSRGETTSPKRIGVTATTARWFAMTGTKQFEPQFKGVIQRAYAASAGPAMQKATAKMRQRIPIEAARARRKGGR